ncbi:MAG: bifunctional 4'-phosphopantothenoylcysteine decarboxylase/phosphopantothenoylcysteine synthetase, partial [Opitutae bacterium]|nr:bifunctional 4'-phosphopantothenoylcysteine decarboxylase/phosphopantothenoylcysteine synthetase [Opitutae bacterium]
ELGRRKQTGQVLVGFAAETENLDGYAAGKLKQKNLDLIVANRIGAVGAGFEVDTNVVSLFYRDGRREDLESMSKNDLAHLLLDRIANLPSGV